MTTTPAQDIIISEAGFVSASFRDAIKDHLSNRINMSTGILLEMTKILNLLYRAGMPLVSDPDYDHYFISLLQSRLDNEEGEAEDLAALAGFLGNVEPEVEGFFEGKTVKLSSRMLSTEKAYDIKTISAWMNRVRKAAEEAGMAPSSLKVRITPKLDGYAALDDGKVLATRGDGYSGTDISRVFDRGLSIAGSAGRGQGAGEIVIETDYFEAYLATHYDNSRNVQAAIIKEGELDPLIKQAIDSRAAIFFPFAALPAWEGDLTTFSDDPQELIDSMWGTVPYDVDGVVCEVPSMRDIMGHTSHHWRNMIAFKRNDPAVPVSVNDVTYQTGKTGRVTPVAELEPTRISNAVISRATLHNIGWMESRQIGAGGVVEVVRSGLVIPKVVGVVEKGEIHLPTDCPSCGAQLRREGDNLWCDNDLFCEAQIGSTLEYFFKTIGHCDGFGPKTIERLIADGIVDLEEIYGLSATDFMALGFGEKTAQNLRDQLDRSTMTPIEDWRFLAAFSLHNVGRGGAERMLQVYPLEQVFDLAVDDLLKIDGFGQAKAQAMLDSLARVGHTIRAMIDKFEEIQATPIGGVQSNSPIASKTVVFTGTMLQGSRGDMEKQAKLLGAKVGKSVSGNTDLLITGENVGASKLKAAEKHGTKVMSEQAYIDMLAAV